MGRDVGRESGVFQPCLIMPAASTMLVGTSASIRSALQLGVVGHRGSDVFMTAFGGEKVYHLVLHRSWSRRNWKIGAKWESTRDFPKRTSNGGLSRTTTRFVPTG